MGKYNKGSRKPPGAKKPPLTHFLCVPLVTETSRPQLEQSIQRFREEHTAQSGADAKTLSGEGEKHQRTEEDSMPLIHPRAVRPVGALHCTLGVMSLNNEQLAEAKSFLESLDTTSLLKDASNQQANTAASAGNTSFESAPTAPLKIDLKGLESMHPPQKTSILYSAPFDSTERLYPLLLAAQKLFKEKGFLVEDDRKLKLHATIVNTIYAKGKKRPAKAVPAQPIASETTLRQAEDTTGKEGAAEASQDPSQGHGPGSNAPLKFDARSLLDRYNDHVWAQGITLEKLAICEMGAKKIADDNGNALGEQYTEVASVALPR